MTLTFTKVKDVLINYLNLEPNSTLHVTQSSFFIILLCTKISETTFTMYVKGRLNSFDRRV